MPAVDKLLEISSPSLIADDLPDAIPLLRESGPLGDELENLLRRRNGFFAFESALHVFPFGRARGVLDIENWNAGSTWRSAYGELFETGLVFAEDLFGFPWCIEGGVITVRDAETGRAAAFANTLEEWAAKILLEWRELTGQPLAHAWQIRDLPDGTKVSFKLTP